MISPWVLSHRGRGDLIKRRHAERLRISDSRTAKRLVRWNPLLTSRALEHDLISRGWCASHVVQVAPAAHPDFSR